MRIKLTAHIKQHAGDVLLECQDSFDYNIENLSFAVSDGVSQAYRPELWSRILTKAFVTSPDSFFVRNEADQYVINSNLGLSNKWAEDEKAAYKNASPQEQFILDMKKNSINIGAATFIGVKLEKGGIVYHTIGDSVLFFFDYETKELSAYSSMMPESGEMVFNNSPEYIDSNECNHGNVISGILPYRKGILFMATDALSDWIVERKASANVIETILQDMMSIPNHDDYDYFVDCARNDENPTKLKDDDTTFIALEFTDVDNESPIIEQRYTEKFDKLYTNNLISELNNAKNESEAQRSARSKSDLALKNKERQIDKLNKDLESAKENEKEKDQEIETLKADVQRLTENIKKLRGDLSSALRDKSTLQNSVTSLKNNNQRLKTENQNLKAENQRFKTENQNLKTENQSLVVENNRLRKSNNTTTDENATIADLKNQLNTSQVKEQKAMDQLKALQDSLIELRGHTSLSPLDLASLPFLGDLGNSTEVQVTTITIGTPTKDGGFKI